MIAVTMPRCGKTRGRRCWRATGATRWPAVSVCRGEKRPEVAGIGVRLEEGQGAAGVGVQSFGRPEAAGIGVQPEEKNQEGAGVTCGSPEATGISTRLEEN